MAKKFVRGITEIKTINNQDFDTNNVNDLLADGNHNYIHRRKSDKSEEYHCLTDNLKSIQSTDTSLLSVHNEGGTNNTATLTVKHDPTKQDILKQGNGIMINNNTIVGNYATRHSEGLDLNTVKHGVVRSNKFTNGPEEGVWLYVTAYSEGEFTVQKAIRQPINDTLYKEYVRYKNAGGWSTWINITPSLIPASTELIEGEDTIEGTGEGTVEEGE